MENRNIIVIGPKNTGKSTVASKILMHSDYPHQPKETTIRTTEKLISDGRYKITVVDTIGSTAEMSRERCNHLKLFLRTHNVDVIHLVIFVIRAGRITGDDMRNLESITDRFKRPQLSGISALVITHCEQYNDSKRQDIVTQFKRDNYTNRIGNLMRGRIITTGFASVDDYEYGENLQTDNKKDIENIDKIIVQADNGVETAELFRATLLDGILQSCLIL